MNVIEKLSQRELFTKAENEVIDFIENHLQSISYMSISELAKQSYSSHATIIRICKKLGFQGFKDFKMELTRSIESSKYLQHDIDFSFPFEYDMSTSDLISHLSNMYKENIHLINATLNIEDLETIVEIIDQSERVFIFAVGDSKISALTFINKCIKIKKFFYLATENNEELSYCQGVTKKDCCLFISYDKNNYYHHCLKTLLYKHCQIITITSHDQDPLFKYSHHSILIPHKEASDKIATFYSQFSFQYILNIIYALLHQKYINS